MQMLMLILHCVAFWSAFVLSREAYVDRIPNGRNLVDANGNPVLGVGHWNSNGAGPRNQFGKDFELANFHWTTALCQTDSDLDGKTNGEELGDPDCTWKEGDPAPPTSSSLLLSHPGVAGDVTGTIDTCKNTSAPPATTPTTNLTLTFTTPFSLPNGVVTTYPRQSFDLRTVPGWTAGNGASFAFKFEPIFGGPPEVVHHMLIYQCTSSNQAQAQISGPSLSGGMPCTGGLVFAWAMGGRPYCLPPQVGIKLNPDDNPFVLLEVHMNNALLSSGIQSQPGFRITIASEASIPPSTPVKRANWLWLGVKLSAINIPPGNPYYEMTSTTVFPRAPGVKLSLIGSMSHTHYLGRKVWVEAKSTTQNRMLTCNPEYNNENQDFVPIATPLVLTDKDTLVVHCVFNSSLKTTVTRGGEETDDEMCFVFLLFMSDQYEEQIQMFGQGTVALSTTPQYTSTECLSQAEVSNGGLTNLPASSVPSWLVAHAVLGSLSIGAMLPIGAMFPAHPSCRKRFQTPQWKNYHVCWIVLGVLCMWTTFGLGAGFVGVVSSHGQLGVSLVVLSLVQMGLGVFKNYFPFKIRSRLAFLHRNLGRITIVVNAAQLFLGYSLLFSSGYVNNSGIVIFGGVHAVGQALLFLSVLLAGQYAMHQRKLQRKKDQPQEISPQTS